MGDEAKTSQINIRIAPRLKRAAEEAAARDHRSLSSLVEKLLTEYSMKDARSDAVIDAVDKAICSLTVGSLKAVDSSRLIEVLQIMEIWSRAIEAELDDRA